MSESFCVNAHAYETTMNTGLPIHPTFGKISDSCAAWGEQPAVISPRRLCLAFIAMTSLQLHAEERMGHLVLGSYLNAEFADTALNRLTGTVDIGLSIVPVDIDGTRYYRIQSELIDEREALDLKHAAHDLNNGQKHGQKREALSRAWFAPVSTSRRQPSTSASVDPPADQIAEPETPALLLTSPDPTQVSQAAAPAMVKLKTSDAVLNIPFIADAAIKIDGRVDEALWLTLPAIDDMRVIDPDSMAQPEFSTQTRLFFNHRGLYVSAVMEQPHDTLVARLSSRDQFLNRDAFGITIDASGEGLYGYWFKVNLGGSLQDGRVLPERTFSEQWDGPWRRRESENRHRLEHRNVLAVVDDGTA